MRLHERRNEYEDLNRAVTDYAAKCVKAALSRMRLVPPTDLRRHDVHHRELDGLSADIRFYGADLSAEDRERAVRTAFIAFDRGLVREHEVAEARRRMGARLEAIGAALRTGAGLPETPAELAALFDDLTDLLAP